MQRSPDAQELIRRAFHVEGRAFRHIQRELCRRCRPPGELSRTAAPSSLFRATPPCGPKKARAEAIMAQYDLLVRVQGYTSRRIFEVTQARCAMGLRVSRPAAHRHLGRGARPHFCLCLPPTTTFVICCLLG
jgi:hypothetical protein